MDNYSKFAAYTHTTVQGVTFPADTKGFLFSHSATAITADLFTYTSSGATESNRVWFSAGTTILPVRVWGISMGTSIAANIYLAY